jgi:hypothetical protein
MVRRYSLLEDWAMMRVLSSACLVLGLASCSVYDPALVEEALAGVPGRPASSTSSPDDSEEAVFAFRNVSLDQSGERWRRFGLDLDGMNTSSSEADHECLSANGEPVVDGEKGIDNAFGQFVLPTVVELLPCLEDNIALQQGAGRGTVLLRIREWNGTPDDAKVDVSVVSAVDGTSLADVSGLLWLGARLVSPDGLVDAPPPAWDGDDVYFVDPGSLVAGDINYPLVWKTDAYISAGRVVLPVDTATTFVFLTGPGSFGLSLNGFLVADISEDGQTLEKGLIAGRFSAGELVATLEPLGICDEQIRDAVTSVLTSNLDVRIDPQLGTSEEPCTASSVAFSFQGIRARIADTLAPMELPIPDPCEASQGGTPAFDLCCRTVELNQPTRLPSECSADVLQSFASTPNPIPVPLEEGF